MTSNFNREIIKNYLLKYIILFLPLFMILGNGVTNFALLIVTMIYLIECIIKKKILYSEKFEFKVFVILYLYIILNSLLSTNLENSIIRALGYVKFFIFVLVYLNYFKNDFNFKKIGFFWLPIILFLSIDIIYQSFFGKDLFGYDTGNPLRNSGFFFDELIAGAFLLGLSILSVFLLNSKIKKPIQYLLLLFFLIACVLTGERSNTIKFLLIFFISHFIIFEISLDKIKKNILMLILIIGIISPVLYFQYDKIKSRYFSSISFSLKGGDNQSLIEQYISSAYGSHSISSLLIFKENFLFGVGNKSFRFECNSVSDDVKKFQQKIYPSISYFPVSCSTHPHQIYYEFLSEHGIFGTLLIISLIFLIIIRRIKQKNLSSLNYAGLLYILIVFIPILPSGSFFTTFNSAIFWLNFLFFLNNTSKV